MQTTGNLGLKKPEGTDVVDIADLNGNADILDTAVSNKVDKVAGKQLSTEDYTTAEKTKLAGIAAGANAYVHPATHPASVITQDASNRFVTDAEKTAWNAKASTAVATTSAAGLQSAADKVKLDGIAAGANNYTHPVNHPPSVITQDASNRFVTDAEKAAWNAKAGTASPSFTGTPLTTTPPDEAATKQIATAEFVYNMARFSSAPAVNSNPNLLLKNGKYDLSSNHANMPSGCSGRVYIEVTGYFDGTYTAQTAYDFNNNKIWTRRQTASTWSAWTLISNETMTLQSGSNLNNVNTNGSYFINKPTSGPVPGVEDYFVTVTTLDVNWTMQTAYDFKSNRIWTRRKVITAWGAWTLVSNETIINVYDANLMLDNGNYYTYTNVNMPTTHLGWTVNVVNVGDAGHIRQTAYALGSTITYTRIKTPSGWGSWTELLTFDSKPYVAGSYTGDGTVTRDILLPFTPTAVLIIPNNSTLFSALGTSSASGGLAVTGSIVSSGNANEIVIGAMKFIITHDRSLAAYSSSGTNTTGKIYNYIAFK
ncbi:pyocin knob domain-containing protein [Paenibacillus sp. FSL K6-3182]|uniref:pyocin knob domain-containing protein n=1 Tax=Paenibacillus sp. FSL K6-3182 TaxID=2921495 RepID=UPI0030D458C6